MRLHASLTRDNPAVPRRTWRNCWLPMLPGRLPMYVCKRTEALASRLNMTLSVSSVRRACIKSHPSLPISFCRIWASMCCTCHDRFSKRLLMNALPLQGLRVVALEQAVAAPFCSRQLADMGADVIKVERPDGG